MKAASDTLSMANISKTRHAIIFLKMVIYSVTSNQVNSGISVLEKNIIDCWKKYNTEIASDEMNLFFCCAESALEIFPEVKWNNT